MYNDKIVLVAAVGMSPAVLTETIWALAQESPPRYPDEVVAITTSGGAARIRETLFGEDRIWDALRASIGEVAVGKLRFGADAAIQVIGNGSQNFSDIATPEENEQCADFILKVLRQYTGDPNTTVIASIAGGRKTMSALMLACMSLLGREQDRVCHVLANDAHINLNKGFFYPRSKQEIADAGIQLSDIPFIRVRGWYQQESGKTPASYSHMVSLFRKSAPRAIAEKKVVLDCANGLFLVDGIDIGLYPNEFAVALVFLLDRTAKQENKTVDQLLEDLKNLSGIPENATWPKALIGGDLATIDDNEDFRKILNRCRGKVKKAGFHSLVKELIPPASSKYSYRAISFRPRRPWTSE